jgi:hypothetical protein
MRANLDKPSYEEYWLDIEGLAQREKVTDEIMPSHTFFDIAFLYHHDKISKINRITYLYFKNTYRIIFVL